jgi:hypothetical protein
MAKLIMTFINGDLNQDAIAEIGKHIDSLGLKKLFFRKTGSIVVTKSTFLSKAASEEVSSLWSDWPSLKGTDKHHLDKACALLNCTKVLDPFCLMPMSSQSWYRPYSTPCYLVQYSFTFDPGLFLYKDTHIHSSEDALGWTCRQTENATTPISLWASGRRYIFTFIRDA